MSKEKGAGGTIINIGSSCSVKPFLSAPIYTATKHAVLGLTKAYGVRPSLGLCYRMLIRYYENEMQTRIVPFSKTFHLKSRKEFVIVFKTAVCQLVQNKYRAFVV